MVPSQAGSLRIWLRNLETVEGVARQRSYALNLVYFVTQGRSLRAFARNASCFCFHLRSGFDNRNLIVRRFCLILSCLAVVLVTLVGRTESFKLTNGQEITGEILPTSANDQGVQIKVGEGSYERVPWTSFSQEDLKRLAQNQRMQPLVEPFIEITREEKIKMTDPNLKQPERLERPSGGSVLGAMFSSGLGIFLLFLIYAANIYAGYEVALFRARPPIMVAGLSAIPFLGFAVPIIFLAMPTRLDRSAERVEPAQSTTAMGAASAANPTKGDVAQATNPMLDESVAHPAGLHLAHEEKQESSLPQTVSFQRGQFTFNRRFFETKFPNFFGVVRREADKDMVLVIKSARGHYVGDRISRIAQNDLHLQVHHTGVSEEVMIPFQEIQEIKLQHKDAK